jgi:hypothetical protein
MHALQPAIRVHFLGKLWQMRELLESEPWGQVLAGASLVRPLPIVVLLRVSGDFSRLLKGAGAVDEYTFILVAPMVSFDKRVLLWLLGRTDIRLKAQAEQEAA